MSNMTPKNIFIAIVFDVNQTFHWVFNLSDHSMYVLPINGL